MYEKEQQIIYNNIKKQKQEQLQEFEESQKRKENEMNNEENKEIDKSCKDTINNSYKLFDGAYQNSRQNANY